MPDKNQNIEAALFETLRTVFGFQTFRPNQEDIIKSIVNRRDVFAVMPTGGGKSLCYQLPAKMMEGTAVIISPLIYFMKDKVDAAVENGIPAAFMNTRSPETDNDCCFTPDWNRLVPNNVTADPSTTDATTTISVVSTVLIPFLCLFVMCIMFP